MSRVKLHDVNGIIARAKELLGVSSDKDLAKKLNLAQSTVANWKHRGNIDLISIISLCDENTSMDWLIFGKGEKEGREDEDITQKIIEILETMDTEQKRHVLRCVENEMLLNQLKKKK